MRADARLLPVAIALLLSLVSCGPSEEQVRRAREEAAAEAAAEARRDEAAGEIRRAVTLAGQEKTEEAWAAWRRARDVVGETPELLAAGDRIRAVEQRQKEARAYGEVLEILNRDTSAGTRRKRLEVLKAAARAGRQWLADWPDSAHAEEVRKGLEYAEAELARHQRLEDTLAAAREGLAGGRPADALTAARAALEMESDDEARDIERRALAALAPEGMVFIEAGEFLSGSKKTPVRVPAFYIDRTEVTNAEYARFVKETGHAAPSHFVEGEPPAGKDEHPVVNICLADALAYAEWAGKRLPTETEWERAARGTDGRDYPWGDEWDEGKGNFRSGGTLPVGSKPFDRSPDGVLDMGGNVMEMTLPAADPTGASEGPVMRGYHWTSEVHESYAKVYMGWPVDRARKAADSGFRCAKSAK